MPTFKDIAIEIDQAALLRREGTPDNPEIKQAARWAAEICQQAARPVLSCRSYSDPVISAQGLALGGAILTIGPNLGLIQNAREVTAAMITIGGGLDEIMAAHQAQGKFLEAYLLGSAGFLALDQVGFRLRTLVEQKAAARGWGVGPALSPGALRGWTLADQPALCRLSDAGAAGVEVSQTFLLRPKYSISLLIGMGPTMSGRKVAPVCTHCALNRSCTHCGEESCSPSP